MKNNINNKEMRTPIDWDFEKREYQMINWKLMSMNKLLISEKEFMIAKFKAIINEFKAAYPDREVINYSFDYKSTEETYHVLGHIISK